MHAHVVVQCSSVIQIQHESLTTVGGKGLCQRYAVLICAVTAPIPIVIFAIEALSARLSVLAMKLKAWVFAAV